MANNLTTETSYIVQTKCAPLGWRRIVNGTFTTQREALKRMVQVDLGLAVRILRITTTRKVLYERPK